MAGPDCCEIWPLKVCSACRRIAEGWVGGSTFAAESYLDNIEAPIEIYTNVRELIRSHDLLKKSVLVYIGEDEAQRKKDYFEFARDVVRPLQVTLQKDIKLLLEKLAQDIGTSD